MLHRISLALIILVLATVIRPLHLHLENEPR
jgi:hypothetical protein